MPHAHLPLASLMQVLPQEPGRIDYYICLCGHFVGVSEIQTPLEVSDLFKAHEELTSCSCSNCESYNLDSEVYRTPSWRPVII